MPISTARLPGERERGFTLIEFSLVILVLGIVSGLVYARFPTALEPDSLRADSLRLAETVRALRRYAVTSGAPVLLRVQLREGRWKADTPGDAAKTKGWDEMAGAEGNLSAGIRLWRILIENERTAPEGEVTLRFLPTGETLAALFSLASSENEERTLLIRPFLNRVEIVHGRTDQMER